LQGLTKVLSSGSGYKLLIKQILHAVSCPLFSSSSSVYKGIFLRQGKKIFLCYFRFSRDETNFLKIFDLSDLAIIIFDFSDKEFDSANFNDISNFEFISLKEEKGETDLTS